MATDQDDHAARIAALEAKIEQLQARDERPSVPDPEPERPVTRRRLIGMAGAAAAGAVGATALAASPAAATDPNDVAIGLPNAGGASATSLASSVSTATFTGSNSTTGAGLKGTASGSPGIGVAGEATALNSNGLTGKATFGNALLLFAPTGQSGSHMRLEPHITVAGPPTSMVDFHSLGQFWMDSAGVLFQCIADGDPGTWVRQAPLVTLAAPVRVYDSRSGQPNQAPNTQGALSFTSAPPSAAFREVACNKDASSGTTVVPAGARTLLMNLAVISISGTGALAAYATGVGQPSTSSINWSAGGQVLANSVTSACNASQHVNVAIVAGAGASANFVLDVIGYYL